MISEGQTYIAIGIASVVTCMTGVCFTAQLIAYHPGAEESVEIREDEDR